MLLRRLMSLALAGLLFASASSAAVAGGNTPVRKRSTAARAVLTQFMVRSEAGVLTSPFQYEPRNLIDLALRALGAVTNYEALRAAPDGVVVNCGTSGHFTARFSPAWSNRLTFEWQDCVSNQYDNTLTMNGPAEVLLPGNSLSPEKVLTLRLGNPLRDLVRHTDPPPYWPDGFPGPSDEVWNMRLTGNVLLARADPSRFFQGRYIYEASGFYRNTITQQIWVNGGYTHEYYAFTNTASTEGAVLTGQTLNPDNSNWSNEIGIVRGRLTGREDISAYPGNPQAYSTSRYISAKDLYLRSGYDGSTRHTFDTIDGQVETDVARWWGVTGCQRPETFTYQTRSPMTINNDIPAVFYYDGGDLLINGASVARFSTSGSQPGVDLMSHVRVAVPGAGTFDYQGLADLLTLLLPEASCAP